MDSMKVTFTLLNGICILIPLRCRFHQLLRPAGLLQNQEALRACQVSFTGAALLASPLRFEGFLSSNMWSSTGALRSAVTAFQPTDERARAAVAQAGP